MTLVGHRLWAEPAVLEAALGPALRLSRAVELQIAPLKTIADAVEQTMRPPMMLAKTIQSTIGNPVIDLLVRQNAIRNMITDQYVRTFAPVLASAAAWAPMMPVQMLWSSRLIGYIDGLHELVAGILAPLRSITSQAVRWLYEALVEAAERAFNALLTEQDPQCRSDVVRRFATQWIGLGNQHPAHLEARLEAVHDVLLSACWRETPTESPFMLRKQLRRQVRETAQVHRPLWRNEIGGAPIMLLSQPRGYNSVTGEPVLIEDTLPDSGDRPAALVDQLDARQRLRQLLAQLSAEQRNIALIKHGDDGITWDDAAHLAGLPAAAGQSTRRKLKRLSHEIQHRQAQRVQ